MTGDERARRAILRKTLRPHIAAEALALSLLDALDAAEESERERCAKIAEGCAGANTYKAMVCDEVAKAIRETKS